MPSRFGEEPLPGIDLSKPYDIYVFERGQQVVVVYRRAFFRGLRGLESSSRFDLASEFYEIEQSNRDVLYVRRHSVFKFCEPGTRLTEESVPPLPDGPVT